MNDDASLVSSFFFSLFYVEIHLSILHIIFDRFLEIFTNIMYPLYMSRKRIMLLVVIHWIVSIVISTVLVVLIAESKYDADKYYQFINFIFWDLAISLSAIATYIYFYKIPYSH